MNRTVAVVGGGGFGRALATACTDNGREVILWTRKEAIEIPGVSPSTSFARVAEADLIFIAVPSTHIRETGDALGAHIDGRHQLVHVSRGLAGPELTTLSEVLREVTPCRRVGALAGPLVADELAKRADHSAIVGTRFPEIVEAVRAAIGGPHLYVEGTSDIVGVEIASALVGVLSVAIGMASGLGVGPGGQAYLASLGMREGARIVESAGGSPSTLFGLAGFADLIAAVAGDQRPEWRFGRELALGQAKEEAASLADAHLESISMARRLHDHAAQRALRAPVCEAMAMTFEQRRGPEEAIRALLASPAPGSTKA
jgi:glycerol-3-phosphate dehydrogenase (NAD(P)+)